MIIGISGKALSGKDTVANIIQWLILKEEKYVEIAFEDFEKYSKASSWKNVKFADKLKDCVCIILGCTREQLEDSIFKETVLGEDWWYWKNKVGSSKFIPYGKELMRTNHFDLIKLTPRLLLQLLGTECGREIIHPDIWVNATFAEYKPLYTQYGNVDYYYNLGNCKYECKHKGDYFELTNGSVEKTKSEDELISLNAIKVYYEYPNWVISDVRFPNEAEAIKNKNGILIRLNRNIRLESIHESETALNNYDDWDYVIDNNGTIEDLIEKIKQILIKEKIIWKAY